MRDRIVRNTVIARPILVPEVLLHLATPETPLWHATEEQAARWGFVDPYWAFCWAGGQAVARYVLDHPSTVAGLPVLDFGSGGGVAAIAAAKAGARVIAADIDPIAAEVTHLNAELNAVSVVTTTKDLIGREDLSFAVVLVGDVTYEPALASRVLHWLCRLTRGGTTVFIGDPGRGYLDKSRLDAAARYEGPADNDPDGSFCVPTTVYRMFGSSPSAGPASPSPC